MPLTNDPTTGGGAGDFLADGSVPMTGNLDLGGNQIVNGNLGLTGVNTIAGSAGQPGALALGEDSGAGSDTVTLQAPSSVASSVTFVLPGADGTAGQAIVTDGSGNLSFSSFGDYFRQNCIFPIFPPLKASFTPLQTHQNRSRIR